MNMQAILWKEDDTYVIKEAVTGVTTQGHTAEEALANFKEATSLYLEEMPEIREAIPRMNMIGALNVEIP